MMLTVTLVAVVLGVTRMNVVIGIGLAVLVTPAFIRTALAAARDRDRGQRMAVPDKIVAFVASLGVVACVAVGSGAAFLATCFGSFWGVAAVGESSFSGYDWLFILLGVAVILGAAAAITVAVFLLKWLWPQRK